MGTRLLRGLVILFSTVKLTMALSSSIGAQIGYSQDFARY